MLAPARLVNELVGVKAIAVAADDNGDEQIVGQDRPGIVREVTTVLAGLDVNIEDFTTAIEGSAWSGAPLFRARAKLLIPATVSTDQVRDALERISGEIMVDFSVQDA